MQTTSHSDRQWKSVRCGRTIRARRKELMYNVHDGLNGHDLLADACNEKEYMKTKVDKADLCNNSDVKANHWISNNSIQID